MEGPQIFKFGYHLISDLLPVLWSARDLLEDCTWIIQLNAELTIWSGNSPALHTSQVCVASQPLSFND